MILIQGERNSAKYTFFTFLFVLTHIASVLCVNCSKTQTRNGHVGDTISLQTSSLSGQGLLYWYKPPCGSNHRLCDYSNYDGKMNTANTSGPQFACVLNATILILLNVTTRDSGQYCSRKLSGSNSLSLYECYNVTVQSQLIPSPLPGPLKAITESNTRTPAIQVQIQAPSSLPQAGTNDTSYPEAQQQSAAHIAGVVVVLLLLLVIIILFFLKIPQKFWDKYHLKKTTAAL
ncbi:membrane protein RL11O [Cercopithecine betaherpesvirus 5]|uniref:Membrane protein RL11O n=1 Tax=Simian cytomegalovirus (strain Colburn) TaxID=50292 RepID=G8XTR5_SCMVC|nr:membrane protein RL11O [Cercopithecine betaherpesvirus 5]